MKYTVNFILDVDDDKIYESEELEDSLRDCLDTASITIRDFKILNVDD